MAVTEKELIDDILNSFKLTKSSLKDLAFYEKDLIYRAFPRYNKVYLRDLLVRAGQDYYKISNKKLAPEPIYPSRPKEYIIKKKVNKIN